MSETDTVTVVVAEDNPASLRNLLTCLETMDRIVVVGTANNGVDAVTLINRTKPDLVFLDVEMPGRNGFEVLEEMEPEPAVIFVTAFETFAVKAFEVNGIDYIVKPATRERLEKAVDKATRSLGANRRHMVALLQDLIGQGQRKKRFSVKVGDQVYFIPKEEVFCFRAEDKYIFLHTRDRSYFYSATLKALEDDLDQDAFVRVNRSTIVAIDKIKKLKKNFRLETCLVLNDDAGTTLKVGKAYLQTLKKKLEF